MSVGRNDFLRGTRGVNSVGGLFGSVGRRCDGWLGSWRLRPRVTTVGVSCLACGYFGSFAVKRCYTWQSAALLQLRRRFHVSVASRLSVERCAEAVVSKCSQAAGKYTTQRLGKVKGCLICLKMAQGLKAMGCVFRLPCQLLLADEDLDRPSTKLSASYSAARVGRCEAPICHLGSWSLCFHAGVTAFARSFDMSSTQVFLSRLQAPALEAAWN